MLMPAATRTARTEKRYLRRFGQLWKRAAKELDRSIGVVDLARRFLAWSEQLSGSSIRQYRATLQFGLERLAQRDPHLSAEIAEAMALLDESRQQVSPTELHIKPKAATPLRTSASKAKGISDADFDAIIAEAPRFRSQYTDDVIAFMEANIVTGHRPIEWYGTTITISGDTLVMIVPNGKHTNERAHGVYRTLIFTGLDPVIRARLLSWHEKVNRLSFEAFESLLKNIEERMRVITKAKFPRRKRRPTPYSTRHAVSARLKRYYIGAAKTRQERDHGAAIVAALMGHAADDTASHHYGNASGRSGRQYPIPKADPEEVARIRPKLTRSRKKMQAMIAARKRPRPR